MFIKDLVEAVKGTVVIARNGNLTSRMRQGPPDPSAVK